MYYIIITNSGLILIIGIDEQEVEDALKKAGIKESSFENQKQRLYRGTCKSKTSEVKLEGFGISDEYAPAVQKEIAEDEGLWRIKINSGEIRNFLHAPA